MKLLVDLLLVAVSTIICVNGGNYSDNQESNKVPLEFWDQISEVTDFQDFIDKFVNKDSIGPQINLNATGEERAAENAYEIAKCEPYTTPVSLEPANREDVAFFYPTCVRAKRCQGCQTQLKQCEPIEKKILDITITIYKVGRQSKPLDFKQKEHVLVDDHIKCAMQCRVKEKHCNPNQIYNSSNCACECKNHDDKQKCVERSDTYWDYKSCECRCEYNEPCTSNYYFNTRSCQCEKVNPKPTILDRSKFIVKAIPVEPSDRTVYATDEI